MLSWLGRLSLRMVDVEDDVEMLAVLRALEARWEAEASERWEEESVLVESEVWRLEGEAWSDGEGECEWCGRPDSLADGER
jgi:hypothetical protein